MSALPDLNRIFISHSSDGSATATFLADGLSSRGHTRLFLDFSKDHGIHAGKDWERELYRNLKSCQALIFICSKDSAASPWCFFELATARANGIPVFPVKIDDSPSLSLIGQIQVVDLRSDRDAGLERLWRGLIDAGLDPTQLFDWDPAAMDQEGPYPGLSTFDAKHAAVFFGREKELQQLRQQLNQAHLANDHRTLFIVGPSGSGKSSLLLAGLLPRLRRDPERWILLDDLRARGAVLLRFQHLLEGALRKAGLEPAIESWMGPEGVGESKIAAPRLNAELERLRLKLDRPNARVLLPIDQFEELLTGEANDQSTRFLEWLSATLSASSNSPLMVVATLRTDFLAHFQSVPAFRTLPIELWPLGGMTRSALRDAILKPAFVHGLPVDPDLADAVLEELGTGISSLPLLAYALQELYRRAPKGTPITRELLQSERGGLRQLIANQAKVVYDRAVADTHLGPEQKEELELSLVHLAQLHADGGWVRRPVPMAAIPKEFRPVYRALQQARLLVPLIPEAPATAGSPSSLNTAAANGHGFEVAHEILFTAWPLLSDRLTRHRDYLQWRRRLAATAEHWETHGKAVHSLFRGTALADADRRLAAMKAWPTLSALEQDYIVCSRRRRAFRRRASLAISAVALMAVALIGAWVHRSRQEARQWDVATRLVDELGNDATSEITAGDIRLLHRLAAENVETRFRFLSQSLAFPGNAERLHRRMEKTIRAAVGFDESFRQRVIRELLAPVLQSYANQDLNPSISQLAAARMAAHLSVADPDLRITAIQVLATHLANVESSSYYGHAPLATELEHLSRELDAVAAGKSATAVATAILRGPHADAPAFLAGSLRWTGASLSPAEMRAVARRVVVAINSNQSATSVFLEAHPSAFELFSSLNSSQAEAVLADLVQALKQEEEWTRGDIATTIAVRAFHCLDDAAATRVGLRLLGDLESMVTSNVWLRTDFPLSCLEPLIPKLKGPAAQRVGDALAQILRSRESKAPREQAATALAKHWSHLASAVPQSSRDAWIKKIAEVACAVDGVEPTAFGSLWLQFDSSVSHHVVLARLPHELTSFGSSWSWVEQARFLGSFLTSQEATDVSLRLIQIIEDASTGLDRRQSASEFLAFLCCRLSPSDAARVAAQLVVSMEMAKDAYALDRYQLPFRRLARLADNASLTKAAKIFSERIDGAYQHLRNASATPSEDAASSPADVGPHSAADPVILPISRSPEEDAIVVPAETDGIHSESLVTSLIEDSGADAELDEAHLFTISELTESVKCLNERLTDTDRVELAFLLASAVDPNATGSVQATAPLFRHLRWLQRQLTATQMREALDALADKVSLSSKNTAPDVWMEGVHEDLMGLGSALVARMASHLAQRLDLPAFKSEVGPDAAKELDYDWVRAARCLAPIQSVLDRESSGKLAKTIRNALFEIRKPDHTANQLYQALALFPPTDSQPAMVIDHLLRMAVSQTKGTEGRPIDSAAWNLVQSLEPLAAFADHLRPEDLDALVQAVLWAINADRGSESSRLHPGLTKLAANLRPDLFQHIVELLTTQALRQTPTSETSASLLLTVLTNSRHEAFASVFPQALRVLQNPESMSQLNTAIQLLDASRFGADSRTALSAARHAVAHLIVEYDPSGSTSAPPAIASSGDWAFRAALGNLLSQLLSRLSEADQRRFLGNVTGQAANALSVDGFRTLLDTLEPFSNLFTADQIRAWLEIPLSTDKTRDRLLSIAENLAGTRFNQDPWQFIAWLQSRR